MRRLLKFCSQHWAVVGLTLVWLILMWTNRLPANTWLMGYDNLLPELNLPLWWERNFFSIWQDYRGLGVANTIMEGTELTRLPFVALVSALAGARFVRWAWVALMLLVGTLATFALTRLWLKLIFVEHKQLTTKVITLAASASALFYLCNPAMVQFFYTPLESFSSWYGFLPLILFVFLRFLRNATSRNLAWLTLVSFLSSSAFHLETFFVVLMMTLGIVALGFLIRRSWRHYARRIALALATVVIANAFWFLPLIVTTLTGSNDFTQTKQNEVSTPQVQEMNYTYGSLDKIALQQGYWFEYREYDQRHNTYGPYLGGWQDFWNLNAVKLLGYFNFGLILVGFGGAFFLVKRRSYLFALTAVFVIGVLMLTTGRGIIIGLPFRLLSHLPLIADIFRVAFTKWSTVVSLGFAFGQALVVSAIYLLLKNMLSKKLVRFTTLGLTLALAAITLIRVYPVFQGELFGWQAKVEFPASYWQLQEFMATQNPTATVIHLPQPNYWGWLFYDWGYRGSGFMWQLISQPLLDRNFDAWSLTNQTAYQELNLALEKADPNLVSQVLEKYGLELAIFDASVLNSNINNPLVGPQKNTELQALLLEAGATEIWHQDKLYVYHFPTSTLTERLSLTDTYQTVSNQSLRVVRDSIYEHEGQYLNLNPKQAAAAIPAVYYPFAAGQSEKLSHLTCTSNQCQVRASFPSGQSGVEKETAPFDYRLLLPALTKQERVIINGSAWFSDPQTIQIKFEPTLHLEIAGQKKLLPGLDSLTLVEVATTQTRAIVDFGDRKPYLVTPERLTDFAVEMVVGVPMTIKVFDAGELTQLTADNVQVAENQVQAYDFPAQIWDKLLQTQELVLTSDQTLAASWEAPSFTLALASQTGHNCDVTSRGQAQKKILLQGASYYAADSANLCESYNLADLSSLNNYVVQFLVEPQQGQPLKFSIIDEASQRLLLDQRLDEQQREQYFFIPRLRLWRNQQHNLFFYLSAQSYGQPSVNTVTNIRLIQYPIEYLSQIKLIPLAPTNVTNLGQIPVGGQKYQLATSNQINASRYLATVAPVASLPKQDQVLVLTRSYDQNWRARARSETGRWQTLVHHRFNGWANAWLLPSPTTTAWQIQLTYWPQQLVVGGLALLGLELLAIISFELCQMWGRCRHFFRFKATKPRRFFK